MGGIVYKRGNNIVSLTGTEYTAPNAGTARLVILTAAGTANTIKYGLTTDATASGYSPAISVAGKKCFIGRKTSSSTSGTSASTYSVTSDTTSSAYTSNYNTTVNTRTSRSETASYTETYGDITGVATSYSRYSYDSYTSSYAYYKTYASYSDKLPMTSVPYYYSSSKTTEFNGNVVVKYYNYTWSESSPNNPGSPRQIASNTAANFAYDYKTYASTMWYHPYNADVALGPSPFGTDYNFHLGISFGIGQNSTKSGVKISVARSMTLYGSGTYLVATNYASGYVFLGSYSTSSFPGYYTRWVNNTLYSMTNSKSWATIEPRATTLTRTITNTNTIYYDTTVNTNSTRTATRSSTYQTRNLTTSVTSSSSISGHNYNI